jgi:hypothetical protein
MEPGVLIAVFESILYSALSWATWIHFVTPRPISLKSVLKFQHVHWRTEALKF